MIHLFKKLYITSDKLTNTHDDRIVISETNGVPAADTISWGKLIAHASSVDELIGTEKQFNNLTEVLELAHNHINITGKKVIIYADDAALSKILFSWYSALLKNANTSQIISIINAHVFKINLLTNGVFGPNNDNIIDFQPIDTSLPVIDTFINSIKPHVGVEFLLASYLSNGSYKDYLKETMQVLIAKNLENYLFELKESFLAHFTVRKFGVALGLEKNYTIDNIHELLSDNSTYSELFFTDRIWNTKKTDAPSSTRNTIRLENITAEDIEKFKNFAAIAGSVWANMNFYKPTESAPYELDFLSVVTNFTDEVLDKIIEVESSFELYTTTFLSTSLGTVNFYIIHSILEDNNTPNKTLTHALSI